MISSFSFSSFNISASQGAKKLRVLGLDGCPVSDEGISSISRHLPSLHTLTLARCKQITEEGVHAATGNLKNLTQISVRLCPKITKAGQRTLATKRPDIKFT
ncbi:hypothetical protein HPB48_025706 [Haemaphysalis longicornis]|uniref:F-box/LRR-repeat protein 15-like leucin rich repeat domain-containing protein n=1 Tax=Haemaphysalis longicornis TaxID=44386 RepID=A0A9J6H877_HAELO|nr:hypothetical protein HPB48_025706 [Haemaphysalis longicornis]